MSFSNWSEVSLSEVINFNPSEKIKKGETAKKIAMNQLKEFNRKISGYEEAEYKSGTKFKNGDTLVARITPCLENGKTAQVSILNEDEVGFGSTEFIVLREKEGITDNNFIYYLSISEKFRSVAIKSMTGTSGRQRAQKDVLENTIINLPPLNEQKAIANILSTLDEKIEVNNQINQTLENMAQELFKRWFVDFEFPNEDGEPYKSSGGEMIESELGLIPEDWGINRIGEVCTCYLGGTPSRKNKDYWDGNIPWINSGKVNDFRILEPSEYITKSGLEKSATKMLKRKTVVLAITGATLGQVSLLEIDTCANQSVVGVTGNSIAPYYYIYPYIQNIIKSIIGNQTGGAQQHINKGNIENTKVIIPQQEVLNKFKKVAHVNYQEIAQLSRENMILKEIRDTLLPKLMSGEIRVPLEGLEESLTEVKGG